jgi:hypothetical protein
MLAGVSTRKNRRAQEPVGERVEADARATSKSAASRMFVRRTSEQLWKLMRRPLSDLRLAVIMLDRSLDVEQRLLFVIDGSKPVEVVRTIEKIVPPEAVTHLEHRELGR